MPTAVLLGEVPYNDIENPASPCTIPWSNFAGNTFLIPGNTINSVGVIDGPLLYCPADTLPATVASITSVRVNIQASGGSGNGGGPANVIAITVGATEGTAQSIGTWFGYGGPSSFSETFLTNPVTGLAWTRASVVSSGYGLKWKTAAAHMTDCTVWGMYLDVEYVELVPTEIDITGSGGAKFGGTGTITKSAVASVSGGIQFDTESDVMAAGAGVPPELHGNQWGLLQFVMQSRLEEKL